MTDIKSRQILDRIRSLLSSLSTNVKISNRVQLTDINIAAEEFYRKLLKLIYGYALENINIVEGMNFPAIDLGDETSGIAIQVTSDSSAEKVKGTIKKFIEKELYKKYPTLYILCIAGKQSSYRAKFDTKGHFVFVASDHVIDCNDLIKEITSAATTKQQEVLDFLETELDTGTRRGTGRRIANEVETLATLITYLSERRNLDGRTQFAAEPDPEGKITKRFADHSAFLTNEIKKLIPQYAQARESVEREMRYGPAQFKITRDYLQQQSDAYLHKYNNDPRRALDELADALANEIGSSGSSYDHAAIRYYLIHELINCNVFPN